MTASFVALLFSPALAQEQCFELDTGITLGRVQDYAPLIARAAREGVTPEQVEFISFTRSGDWSMIFAATPVADPGYFFFQEVEGKREFKDVWGGIAFASEKQAISDWATDFGAPSDLAACFAETVADTPDEG